MKILLVEDDANSRILMEKYLNNKGYSTESTTNGRQALKIARESHPGIIISDIMMNDMDGFEFCRQVKADKDLRSIPFVFYTATYIEKQQRDLAMSLGASRFIIKPIEPEELISTINELFDENADKSETSGSEATEANRDEFSSPNYEVMANKLANRVRELEQEREELQRSEQKYRRLVKTLRAQKMESINQMTGVITHDFNNILSAIIGYGHILKMNIGEENPHRKSVDQILSASNRATNLIQGLQAVSRKNPIYVRPLDLNRLIEKIRPLISQHIPNIIEIRTDLNPMPNGSPLLALADKGQIEQAIINLATNACDAMTNGGLLTIKTDTIELDDKFIEKNLLGKPGQYAVIEITDTGAGIDEEILEKIYDPFFTTKPKGKGTGLGLAMVYGIVNQHNGFIYVESRLTKGTKFTILLPVTGQNPNNKETRLKKTVDTHKGGTETVLVAEDDENLRVLITTILTNYGYKVIGAVNGADALSKFNEQTESVQLVVTDLLMPEKNGDELFQEISKIRPDLKAIIMTGYDEDTISHKLAGLENITILTKPVYPDSLLTKVREVLDRS